MHNHTDSKNPELDFLVGEWEHGAMNRREFFQRAVLLLGTVSAAEALLTACSPAVVPTATPIPATATSAPSATVAPSATATRVPVTATSAPAATNTPGVTATRPPASPAGPSATPPPTPVASMIPGYIEAAVVDSSEVNYSSGEVKMRAILAKPKTGGPFPGVIVIHENRGLTDHIIDVTRRIANLGYVALGVDLLSRAGGTPKFAPPADPTQAINALKQSEVDADLLASIAYLKTLSFVKPKFGVVGFCWGGANSLLTAINSKDINAAIVFYGRNPANIDDVQKIAGAVIGNYGETDSSITPGVPALEAAMKKHSKSFESKIYPGAGHAFFNDSGPRFNEAAAKDAWARLIAFYKTHLQA